jgi:polyisoprenoid-binding protein YceI
MININDMKTKVLILSAFLFFSIFILGNKGFEIKTYKIDKQKTAVNVTGTSNLHDWETNVTNIDGDLSVIMSSNDIIENINSLNINFYAKSFNSGKSGMDSKTTEALKAEKYPVINFKLKSITEKKLINKIQQFTALGILTIAGSAKSITVDAFSAIGANNEIYFQGTKTIDMTQYNVKPPTALLGTLTTGKDVTVTYKLFFL